MRRIGFKLWSGMMLLVVIVLMILWLFQIVFLDQFYKNIKISELIQKGNDIVEDIGQERDLSETVNSEIFQEEMEKLVYTMQLSLEVFDHQGNSIYQADYSENAMGKGRMKNASSEALQIALSGEVAQVETQHPRFGSDYVVLGLPIVLHETVEGVLILNIPLAPVEDTAAILKQQLLWITIILLAVSILISFFMSKSFTQPILKINKAADEYSKGNFEVRVKTQSKDELGELAERMNVMGEKLAESDQLRKELIANVSHELRTPLSLIRGYAETLRDVTGANPEKREKQLGVIIDESERLTRIVEDILSLSQYQAGAIKLDIKAFSLNQMLDGIMKRYDLNQLQREIFITGIGTKEIWILADQGRVEQVLYNLINNAINHTDENGTIEIKLMDNQEYIKLEIIDNGVGISAEELPNLFERYYKGKKDGRSKNKSTGLGLAIVKSILQMHQVRFGVESQVGEGTTFWFELKKDLALSNMKV